MSVITTHDIQMHANYGSNQTSHPLSLKVNHSIAYGVMETAVSRTRDNGA